MQISKKDGKIQIRKRYFRWRWQLTGIAFCIMLLFAGCTTRRPSLHEDTEAKNEVVTEKDSEASYDTGQEPGTESDTGTNVKTGTDLEDETDRISSDADALYQELSDCYESILPYQDAPYIEINGNRPFFTQDEIVTNSYEFYSELDALGRCGTAIACVGVDLMPTEPRGTIGSVRPSGWHTVKYHDIIPDNYLYNRCHLIGYQLAGENANPLNLITGTRYLNREGMLPFEEQVSTYVKKTQNHVIYRVTPYYEGDNLVASGVFMEALSVEDEGKELAFCVYCYNVQPGIVIDYANGDSFIDETSEYVLRIREQQEKEAAESKEAEESNYVYAVNGKNGKIHIIGDCSATGNDSNAMKEPIYCETYEEALAISERVAPNQSKRNCGNCYQ